jgi:hypothetical protein
VGSKKFPPHIPFPRGAKFLNYAPAECPKMALAGGSFGVALEQQPLPQVACTQTASSALNTASRPRKIQRGAPLRFFVRAGNQRFVGSPAVFGPAIAPRFNQRIGCRTPL